MFETNQILDTFLKQSFDGVLLIDSNMRIVQYNRLIAKIFSCKEKDLTDQSLWDIFPFFRDFETQFSTLWLGESFKLKDKSYKKSQFDDKILYEINASPLQNEAGAFDKAILIIRDVSELKSKEKSLTKKRLKDALKAYDFSSDRLKCIIHSTSDLIASIDTNFRFILYNDTFKQFFEEFTGKNINLGVSFLDCLKHLPKEYAKAKSNWEKALAGEEFQFIDKIQLTNNQSFFVEISYNLVRDREGNVLGASYVMRDITERLKTEELWIASERRFSKMFDEAGIGLLLTNLENKKIIQANPAMLELTGFQLQDLPDLSIRSLSNEEDYDKEKIFIKKLLNGEITRYEIEKRIFGKNGNEIWISATTTLLYDFENRPEYALSTIENITDKKIAQQRLQESEAQKTALINAFPDMIFQIDGNGKVLDFRLKDYEFKVIPNNPIGKSVLDVDFPKKVKNRIIGVIRNALQSGLVEFYEVELPIDNYILHYEARFVKCATNEVLVIVRDISKRKQEETKIIELLEKERCLNHNLEVQNEKLAMQEKELAIANEQLVLQNENLSKTTKELRVSREKLKEALRTLEERNFELDQFVYKTSHDLRSPLTSILGIINLIKLEKDQSYFMDYTHMIEGRILRLDDFIQSMLHYSRNNRSDLQTEKIDYHNILEECLDDLKYYKHFDSIEKKWHIEGQDTAFFSDILRLKILFANIISNAIKYQDFDKKHRFIEVRIKVETEKTILIFSDNGIGIEEAYLKDIYKMFYRATEASEGSGLGLYIVKQTVDKLKGQIVMLSAGNKAGLEISIELPNRKKNPLILNKQMQES